MGKETDMLRGLSCAVTAYFVYTVLNLVAVTVALDEMQAHRQVLRFNVDSLQEINDQLQLELAELSVSPDLIRLYARDLSLYAPGEHVLRLRHSNGQVPFYHQAGMIVPPLVLPRAPRLAFLVVGVAVGGMLYGWFRLRERSLRNSDREQQPEDPVFLLPNAAARRHSDPSR